MVARREEEGILVKIVLEGLRRQIDCCRKSFEKLRRIENPFGLEGAECHTRSSWHAWSALEKRRKDGKLGSCIFFESKVVVIIQDVFARLRSR
jgi:hypothetical protein